jgi:hypothetical protein
MKLHQVAVFVVLCGALLAQTKHEVSPTPARNAREKTDLLTPTTPVVPTNLPDRYNEGIFTTKEQMHDAEIADLKGRVLFLEGRSNFVTGAVWAIGILFAVSLAVLKLFWRGIVQVLLLEIQPRSPIASDDRSK